MPLVALLAATSLAAAATPPPPWQRGPAVPATAGDARVVAREWSRAANRADCAPLTFSTVRTGGVTQARPRRAEFSGGWGVAWDRPGQRSAFGIAGAGVDVQAGDITRWPAVVRWSDGSAMGYGLTGDTGPGWLAYIRVSGQGCLYNVWSNVSRRHLRLLVAHLRRVGGA